MNSIDINCDLGEGFGIYNIGHDAALMDYITSVNIACGFHAGDPAVMYKTVALALQKGVAIGAHPGLPDLQGFGRRSMDIRPKETYEITLYQIGALHAFVQAQGGNLHHVKPHGALYNMAARNRAVANAIAQAVYDFDRHLILYGLSGSALIHAGRDQGLRTASEVFADRTYQDDGSLTSRQHPQALITDVQKAVQQALQMVQEGTVPTIQQKAIPIIADTICLHGDGTHAVEFARAIHCSLKNAGIFLKAFTAN